MKYNISFDIDFKRNKNKGLFIALDGLDGSGKTTQAHMLVDRLKQEGHNAVYTKEPTDEPTGKLIRSILSGEVKVPAASWQYLFVADRVVHLEEVEKWLSQGKIVVTDRYFWSSVAYGVADRGFKGDFYLVALSVLSCYHQFLIPDLNFYLSITPEIGMKRINANRAEKEIYEKKSKLLEIEKGYKMLLKKFPKEFTIIDGARDIDSVHEDLYKMVLKKIKNRK